MDYKMLFELRFTTRQYLASSTTLLKTFEGYLRQPLHYQFFFQMCKMLCLVQKQASRTKQTEEQK